MNDLQPSRPGRPHAIQIRVSEDEKTAIQAVANAAGVETSVWVRAVIVQKLKRLAKATAP